jgi:hypothetical protein
MLEGACVGAARFVNPLRRRRVGLWVISNYVSFRGYLDVKARYHIKLSRGRQES